MTDPLSRRQREEVFRHLPRQAIEGRRFQELLRRSFLSEQGFDPPAQFLVARAHPRKRVRAIARLEFERLLQHGVNLFPSRSIHRWFLPRLSVARIDTYEFVRPVTPRTATDGRSEHMYAGKTEPPSPRLGSLLAVTISAGTANISSAFHLTAESLGA
jgi:hypothetical protein